LKFLKNQIVDAAFVSALLTARLELTAELQHAFNGEIVVASMKKINFQFRMESVCSRRTDEKRGLAVRRCAVEAEFARIQFCKKVRKPKRKIQNIINFWILTGCWRRFRPQNAAVGLRS
jgi:hypothetical protein